MALSQGAAAAPCPGSMEPEAAAELLMEEEGEPRTVAAGDWAAARRPWARTAALGLAAAGGLLLLLAPGLRAAGLVPQGLVSLFSGYAPDVVPGYRDLHGNCAGGNTAAGLMTESDLRSCAFKCNQNPQCKGFSYNAKINKCANKVKDCWSPQGGTEWTFFKKEGVNLIVPGYTPRGGDCTGHDLGGPQKYITLQDCTRKCDSSASCRGVSYNAQKRTCYPKSAACTDPKKIEGWVFHEREMAPGYDKMNGDCPGKPMPQFIRVRLHIQDCKYQCDNTEGCAGFTYIMDKQWCMPKSSACQWPQGGQGVFFYRKQGR